MCCGGLELVNALTTHIRTSVFVKSLEVEELVGQTLRWQRVQVLSNQLRQLVRVLASGWNAHGSLKSKPEQC